MKPDFATMSRAQLRAYVLEHREDTEAFQALADRILANPHLKWYAPDEINCLPKILAEQQQRHQQSKSSDKI